VTLNAAVLTEKLGVKSRRRDAARNVKAFDTTKHCITANTRSGLQLLLIIVILFYDAVGWVAGRASGL